MQTKQDMVFDTHADVGRPSHVSLLLFRNKCQMSTCQRHESLAPRVEIFCTTEHVSEEYR